MSCHPTSAVRFLVAHLLQLLILDDPRRSYCGVEWFENVTLNQQIDVSVIIWGKLHQLFSHLQQQNKELKFFFSSMISDIII